MKKPKVKAAPKPPKPEPPPPMPDPEITARDKERDYERRLAGRKGRSSTILSEGGGSNKLG